MSWTLIESQILSNSAASITLGSGGTIPQTYKTLKIFISARADSSFPGGRLAFNGTNSNYSGRGLWSDGSGSAPSTWSYSSAADIDLSNLPGTVNLSGMFCVTEIVIPNYSGSTNKPLTTDMAIENNKATSETYARNAMIANFWTNTAAITSITFSASSGNLIAGTSVSLYGLK